MDSNPGLLSSALIEFGRCGNYCCHSMTDAKQHAGFAPLETLPAEWYNNYNYLLDTHINQVQTILRQAQTEIANVLEAGGQTPDATSTCQLLPAINCLIADARPAIATGSAAGLVASSNASNAVSVNGTTGVMTPNALCDWSASTTVKSCIDSVVSGTVSNATLFAGCSCAEWKSIIEGSTVAQANSTLTFGGYTYEQAKADIRSGLSGNTGTVTSVSVYCDSALVQTITESGSICLSKNAFNAYAEISTTVYPGACCTGTSDYVVTTKVCCSETADTAGTSSISNALSYTGTGTSVVTAFQTAEPYFGSSAEWASYLIFNHGDGSNYYHQMLRMPFFGAPQYQRMQNNVNDIWHAFITEENIASQSVANADCLGGVCGACFFFSRAVDLNSDCWSEYYNHNGSYRDPTHAPDWNGSVYALSSPNSASQSSLLFRILGGSEGPNQVQMNYGIDYNRFGMNWATIINSENIGSQSVANATNATNATNASYVNFNGVADADLIIIDPSVCHVNRKVYYYTAFNQQGFYQRFAIGMCRNFSECGWGAALLSVGTNDAGTAWQDYKFDANGYITAPGGYLTASGITLNATADCPIHLENGIHGIYLKNDCSITIGAVGGSVQYGIALGYNSYACARGVAAGSTAWAWTDSVALGVNSRAVTDETVAIGAQSCAIGCRIMHMRSGTWRRAVFSFAKGTQQCVIWNWLAACGADYSPMWPAYNCSYCGRHLVGGVWQMRNASCSELGLTLSWDGDSNIDFTEPKLGSDHNIYRDCTATIPERIMVDVSWETVYS